MFVEVDYKKYVRTLSAFELLAEFEIATLPPHAKRKETYSPKQYRCLRAEILRRLEVEEKAQEDTVKPYTGAFVLSREKSIIF